MSDVFGGNKMVKLQDFAKQQGVTDRQIQRLLKKYEVELEGLFERRNQNGTWLSDEACDILKSKMKTNPVVVIDDETEKLRKRIEELEERMERKDLLIEKLQSRVEEKECYIEGIKKEQLLLEEQVKEAESERLRAENAEAELERLKGRSLLERIARKYE